MQKHEFDLALELVVEAIGRGKGVDRVREELIDFVGEEAGKWFDQELGSDRAPGFQVFVKDWTGVSVSR